MQLPQTYPNRFADRSAIVTGGASGIGLAVVRRLLEEGGRVAIWDRDAAQARKMMAGSLAGTAAIFDVDVSQSAAIAAAMGPTLDFLEGHVDVLVTSAGITGPNVALADYPVEEWRRVFEVNLHGVFHCNRAVLPAMLGRNYGRIVNISSVAGKEGNPNASAYSASKAAVIGMTKSLGKELAKTGITANCVTPAAVRTPIFEQMSQQHIDFMLAKIPMARFGETAEIAAAILWLASQEASFTTGAVLDVSGGRATY